MADDKRAEAMKKAIAEADAANAAGSKKKEPSSGSGKADILKQVQGHAGKGVGEAKKMVGKLWGHKTGRIGIFAVLGVFALIVLVSIFSGISGHVENLPVSYEMSDAVLCAYEDPTKQFEYAYDAYVEITNTGESNIYAKDMSFMIQDGNGDRVMIDNSISAFPAVIEPGEKGYLFNRFGTELKNVYDPEMELFLVPTFSIMRAEAAPRKYAVENVKISQGPDGQVMTGSVVNDTGDEVQTMYVVGVCYNEDGRCIGISGQFLNNVEPHVSVNVTFDPMTMIAAWKNAKVVDYVVYAY